MKRLIKLFESGNVCVTGLRGTGKDMLFANVVSRRRQLYVSNVDYKCKRSLHLPLNFDKLDPLNNYENFVSGDIVPYEYPYPERADIYVSDAGVYFPSYDFKELNQKYERFPVFQALSRQLGDCNFHINVQNLNRVWDKIREQSDIYIRCLSCRVLGKVVFQRVCIYDKYDSCVNRVRPFVPLRPRLLASKEEKALVRSQNISAKRDFDERNGYVKEILLIYKNKSKYDTRLFKSLLKGGKMA